MKLFLISDLHISPLIVSERQEHIEKLLIAAERAEAKDFQVLGLGDIADALEFGYEELLKHPFCRKVMAWFESRKRLAGNHDPKSGLLSLDIDGYHFSHWHEFDLLWSWLPITRIWLPNWLVKYYRTPAQKKGHNLEDWHLSTATCEYLATSYAIKNGYKGIIGGHTHMPIDIRREGYLVMNIGDGVDSFTYALLNTDTGDHTLVGF